MKQTKFYRLSIYFFAIACLFGCQSQNEGEDQTQPELNVVASFLPMYEFTKQVAGDRADVQLMVSQGQDAHSYEPSAQDVAAVNQADVFIYSSEEMEFWVNSLFNTLENDTLIIARAADGLNNTTQNDRTDEASTQEVISISGVAHHYHTEDEIVLTAELSGNTNFDHWHWYQRDDASQEWQAVSGQSTETFSIKAPEESFEIQAVLYDNEHTIYAESDPVTITIDNHDNHNHEENDQEHSENNNDTNSTETQIDIKGVADHYHTGDVVTLAAELNEETSYDHWHWFMKEESNDEWQAVPDQVTNYFEYTTTGTSFDVKAVLYDDNHNVYIESEPVSVLIDDHDDQDPHIWLDPVLAQDQVAVIRDALIEADPEGKDIYEENAKTFIEELQTLDQEYETALKDAENRAFVVQHQAFGYLADRYNLEQIAIGGYLQKWSLVLHEWPK